MSRQFSATPAVATFDFVRVSDGMYRMLGVLSSYANRDGWCWPKLETLAERTGKSPGSVSRMIRKLIEAGYVEMHYEARDGRRRCMYRVIYDRPAASAQSVTDGELEEADEAPEGVDSHPRVAASATLDENGEPSKVAATATRRASSFAPAATQGPPVQTSTCSQAASHILSNRPEEQTSTASPPPARARWQVLLDRAASLSSPYDRALADAIGRTGTAGDFRANAFAAEIEAIEQGMHGPAATLEQIAAALHEMAVAGVELKAGLIRAWVRGVKRGEPPPSAVSGRALVRGGEVQVRVGSQELGEREFWQLCTDVGLTLPMQSADTVRAEVERLVSSGRVRDGEAFLALVLHVNPAQLAEMRFAKAREEQLRSRLASWRGRAA